MRLLYCIPDLGQGGAERQLSYLAAELARAGHDVHVASCRGGPNLERMKAAGVVWHRLVREGERGRGTLFGLGSLVRAFAVFFRLVGLMRELRPDVVQTILAPMDMLGGAAALLTRTPWVLKESSSALAYTTDWKYWFRFAFGRLSDAVVANSEGGYEYWRGARGRRTLRVIPNGIPLGEIAAAEPGRAGGFEPGPGERVVLYAGRVDIGKNVEDLIAALARIAGEVPFAAVICGDGTHLGRVQRMARELGIADRVFFTGYVGNLWSLMKRADAFVSMSRCEGRPNVVLEAMACGCPLIVSDIPAHREILDERAALFAGPDDPEKTAAALRATLLRGDEARERAHAARVKVSGWPVEKMARLYEETYAGLLGEARAPEREEPITGSKAA
ncbi:MAG TPA: glycosyltransferase [Pyrinomonadaceae bacterium]|jgi:glycosyltransferase involved in cell wall biosynthesis|nr:glycosyltransferase [Pyrinomonadaceae bacterium]